MNDTHCSLFRSCLLAAGILSLVACGGGEVADSSARAQSADAAGRQGILAAGDPAAAAVATNIALGKPVTLEGSFFTGGWGGGLVVSGNTLTDGIFFPTGHQWDQGPVWWDYHLQDGQTITIDLQGMHWVESYIVQGDNNDAYKLSHWDASTSDWVLDWDVPTLGNWGMFTRPDYTDNTARHSLSAPVLTNQLRLTLNEVITDQYGSVSEIQAFGFKAVEGYVTGGGMVSTPSGRIGFSGNVGMLEGKIVGQFRWTDHATKTSYHSTGFSQLAFSGGPATSPVAPANTATFLATFRNNRNGMVTSTWVRIVDIAEGGSKSTVDQIGFSPDGVSWTLYPLSGGNVQVHGSTGS